MHRGTHAQDGERARAGRGVVWLLLQHVCVCVLDAGTHALESSRTRQCPGRKRDVGLGSERRDVALDTPTTHARKRISGTSGTETVVSCLLFRCGRPVAAHRAQRSI
eukprot:959191-Rhodomonas_salina.1